MYRQDPQIDPGTSDRNIVNPSQERFKDVVAVFNNTFKGSGFLVSQTHVLTAAHNTNYNERFTSSIIDHSSLRVSFFSHINDGNRVDTKKCSKIPNVDLAIITLLDRTLVNMPIIPFASTSEIEQAGKGIIVGYGINQTRFFGERMFADVTIQKGQTDNKFLGVLLNQGVTGNNGEIDGIQHGDSGGPLYITVNNQLKVAGVCIYTRERIRGMYLRVDKFALPSNP